MDLQIKRKTAVITGGAKGIGAGYVLSNDYRDSASAQCRAREKYLRIGWATPEDMGRIAAFLCSPCSRQIIGAVIDCSGGTML